MSGASVHVLVLPGGSYATHAERSSEPIVDWLASIGVSASVFRYPLMTRHPGPLLAIRAEIRSRRAAGVDTVGLMGFSAGGHAAGLAAYAPHGERDEVPDFVALAYPVVSMELGSHGASRINLLGEDADAALRVATSLDRLVSPGAPPSFFWHTVGDTVVPVEHAYLLGSALARSGVPHEAHIFERGNHALGLARDAGPASAWTTLCRSWLRSYEWAP
ncbi:prolyl oligopeptidase family serine peptidase [Microbacterium sp. LMI12-1-1.1]|uniref:alpha/beta hydrolase n=1 Tax=Microbacterium sp. LMI12-1-1.1 TaxID=3135225 RepID=UPI003433B2F6